MIPNPWVLLALGVAWIASVIGAFHFGTSYEEGVEAKTKLVIADTVKKSREGDQAFADAIGSKVEQQLGNLRIKNTTITNEVHHEREIQTMVLDNPNCALPDSTVRLLNSARGYRDGAAGPSTGEPASGVPAVGPASGSGAGGTGIGR